MDKYSRRKQYVETLISFQIDGSIVPHSVTLADGRVFEIERVMTAHVVRNGQPGKTITRYPVTIRGQDTSLFFDGARWYVEMKDVISPR